MERRDIAVSPGDRVVVPTMTIELGALSETVTVTGEAPLIQAQSGERSSTVTTEAVQNLPIANRNFGGLASLTPGVIGTTRIGTPGSTTNFQIDGVSTIDTGAGGQALQLNVEAIAEVRVIASGYQAEYGRNIGLQITGVTKSGTNQYRGSIYDIQRNSDWNSNSWVNAANGDPKAVSKQQDWGYTLGGPIGKPGGDNRWFFFYSHEYRPRKTGGAINRFRVPTLLERQGDFSQSTDNNGALFNIIRDASTGLPCSATDTRGCFQDGGVVGRIPQNRLYPRHERAEAVAGAQRQRPELQPRDRGTGRHAADASADGASRLAAVIQVAVYDEVRRSARDGQSDAWLDPGVQRRDQSVPLHHGRLWNG